MASDTPTRVLRFHVNEIGHAALPALDLDAATILIGNAATAQIRLPATAVQETHVRITDARWHALADVGVDGTARKAGESGALGSGVELEFGQYRVKIAAAPSGVDIASPQRTDSLARELVRSLLGDGGAPTLEVESGAHAGATRQLAAPPSSIIIGRGDEASWVILDEDLSRAHAEIRRDWDGVRVIDRDSKNGTRVDGEPVGDEGTPILDGALVELGKIAFRFRDPAERHLRGELAPPTVTRERTPSKGVTPAPRTRAPSLPPAPSPVPRTSPMFWVAIAIAGVALGGLVWILAG